MARRNQERVTYDLGNQFAMPAATAVPTSVQNQKFQNRWPRRFRFLLLLIFLAAVGGAIFWYYHRPATRSSNAVAVDFIQQQVNENYRAASLDIDPADRGFALTTMQSHEYLVAGPAFSSDTFKPEANAVDTGADTATSRIDLCGSGFSCSFLASIDTIRINGKWYVSWTQWVSSNPEYSPGDGVTTGTTQP